MKKLIIASLGTLFLFVGCNLQNSEVKDVEENEQVQELEKKVAQLENALAEEKGQVEKEKPTEDKKIVEEEEKPEEIEEPVYEGPNFITLASPKNNAGLSKQPVIFTGEVSPNTQKIIVTSKSDGPDGPVQQNVYQLQSFKEGDKIFKYNARLDFGNLKAGQNYYEFEAFFNDGTKKKEEIIINFYVGENNISLSQPSSNDRFTSTPIEFKGTVSPNTTKVVVKAWRSAGTYGEFEYDGYQDVYTLQNYKAGDSSFTYKASTDFNNLRIGPNNYEFIAYFDDGTTESVEAYNIWFAR